MAKVGHRKGDFSASLRLDVIQRLSENKTQKEIAAEVGITPSDVCRILYNRNKIISDCFDSQFHKNGRRRRGKYYDLDRAVAEWFMMTQRFDIPVTMHDLVTKAQIFAKHFDIKIWKPDLWCKSWRYKYSVVRKQHHMLQFHCAKVNDYQDNNEILNRYKPEEIYTVSEVGLYFEPQKHLILKDTLTDFENQGRDDLTVLMSVNQSGSDKRPLVVVGKELPLFVLNLPCIYKTDRNCWMTSDIFVDWLLDLDEEMKSQNRRILLVLKKSPVHPCEAQKDLSNVKLLFVDCNSGIHLPCEQGIADHLKLHYKQGLIHKTRLFPQGKLELLDALHLLSKVWMDLPPIGIKECFNLEGLKTNDRIGQSDMQGAAEACTDSNLDFQCCGMPMDDEICAKVMALKKEEPELDSNICASKCLQQMEGVATDSQVLGSLSKLRHYIEDTDLKDFRLFYALETQVIEKIRRNQRDLGFESIELDKCR